MSSPDRSAEARTGRAALPIRSGMDVYGPDGLRYIGSVVGVIHGSGGIERFLVRPGRLNLGFLARPLSIPSSAIRTISLERIALDVEPDEIPVAWRHNTV